MPVTYIRSGYTQNDLLPTTTHFCDLTGATQGETYVIVLTPDAEDVAITPPAGVVQRLSTTYAGISASCLVYTYVVPASPPASLVWTWSVAHEGSVSWMVFSGVDTSNPVDVLPSQSGWALGNTDTAPAVTTVSANAYVVGGLSIPSGSRVVTTPSGWTNRVTATDRIGSMGTKGLQAVAGSTGTAAWSHDGTALRGCAWQMALRSSGAGGVSPTMLYSIVGNLKTDGFAVSVKSPDAVQSRITAGTNALLSSGLVTSLGSVNDADGWAQPVISGLSSGIQYWYRVDLFDGSSWYDGSTIYGPFKTIPTPGVPANLKIAFGSCLENNSSDGTSFTNALNRSPDMFAHLGDYHYADSTSTTQSVHRVNLENQMVANSALVTLQGNVPFYALKSDHDSGPNGAVAGAHTASHYAAWKQVFPLEWVENGPVYRSFVWGRTRLIFLDTRYNLTTSSMISASQMTWLKSELIQPEPLKLVFTDSPWIGAYTAGDDKWYGYGSTDRAEIGSYVDANDCGQIVLCHGDAHAILADDGSNNQWGGFPVVGAAPFGGKSTSIKGGPYSESYWPNPVGAVVPQYGMLDITDNGSTISVSYAGYDQTNTARITLNVATSAPYSEPTVLNGYWGIQNTIVPSAPLESPSPTWRHAGNTGVPSGTSLTAYSGSMSRSDSNGVIDSQIISGTLTINVGTGNAFYVRKCKFIASSFIDTHIMVLSGDLYIEDCELDGSDKVSTGIRFTSGHYIADRLNIHNLYDGDGVKISSGCTIRDSWIHDINDIQGAHNDGMQCESNGKNVVITGNSIVMLPTHTSCFMFKNDLGSDPNSPGPITVDRNYIQGGGYSLYAVPGTGGNLIQNISVTNNMFGGQTGFGNASLDASMPITQSGNVNISGNPISL